MSKVQIRQGVFETNSSSVHSITMVDKTEYEDWKNGKLLFCEGEFLPVDEAIEKNIESLKDYLDGEDIPQSFIDEYKKTKSLSRALSNCDEIDLEFDDIDSYDVYLTHEEWDEMVGDRWYYEMFEDEYTTKSGDEVVAFGYYGHD